MIKKKAASRTRLRILTQLKDLKLIERMGIDEKQDIVK